MESHYLCLIWNQLFTTKNQNLTTEEHQKAILVILSEMKTMAENDAKRAIKKLFIQEISKTINAI